MPSVPLPGGRGYALDEIPGCGYGLLCNIRTLTGESNSTQNLHPYPERGYAVEDIPNLQYFFPVSLT